MKLENNYDYISLDISLDSITAKEIETPNCITGDTNYLLPKLKESFKKAVSIDIIVAFLMESGVKLLKEELKEIVNKNIPIRILTGNYLNITQPQALYMLKDIMGDKVDLRFYNIPNKSFHPKAYIFEYEKDGDLYVGSSNISRSALTSGIEWNYRLNKDKNIDDFNSFKSTFEDLFLNHSTIIDEEEMRKYSESWVRPKVYKHIDNNENVSLNKDNNLIELYEPRGAQIEALYELKKRREEGYDKGLVVAATGIGKTYLAAFDSKDYNRILFVAHRAEIINQAAVSFKNVRPDKSIGFFYSNNKDNTSDFIFATVQTLGKLEYLNDKYFAKDAFDYIVIDEFHHAAAGNYKNIIDYFQPKFMLGLTATPERLDNKDVFALCDNNVAYEVRLKSAINKGWLVPFRYYGIYDELVNYETIEYKNDKYDSNKLEKALMINKRADLIIGHYSKYKSERALGFCSSRKHAEFMTEYFCSKGVKACAVVSEGRSSCSVDRNEAVNKLTKGEVKFIFTVDLYNEGVDIPEVNTVLFLRPTESLTVFLQQLGRGLRLCEGKECLTVLDFVGQAHKNYDFEQKFKALIGKSKHSVEYSINNGFLNLPKGCYIHLEKQAKEYILRNIKEAKLTKASLISKLKYFEGDTYKKPTLGNFLDYYNYSLVDVYGKNGNRSFSRIKVEAGLIDDYVNKDEVLLTKKMKNLFHINSRKLIEFMIKVLTLKSKLDTSNLDEEEKHMLGMLYYSFYMEPPEKIGYKSFSEALYNICSNNKELIKEAVEILDYNYLHIDFIDKTVDLGGAVPLDLHCNYSIDQIMAAFGYFNENKKPSFREGVKYFREMKVDAFFITLNKSEKDYSPSTLYEDYAMNERLFHWQSQSRTSLESETGQRYINHFKTGNKIVLFVRENKKKDGLAAPYTYLGEAEYVSHRGSMPISFVWRLKEEMPAGIMGAANKGIV